MSGIFAIFATGLAGVAILAAYHAGDAEASRQGVRDCLLGSSLLAALLALLGAYTAGSMS